MKLGIALFVVAAIGMHFSANAGESAELVTASGDHLDLNKLAESKFGRVVYEADGKRATLVIPSHSAIHFEKKKGAEWRTTSTINNKLFSVWKIGIIVTKSIKNGAVELTGSGNSFSTDNEGNGEGEFYVDQVSEKHRVSVHKVGSNKIDDEILITAPSTFECQGNPNFKCK